MSCCVFRSAKGTTPPPHCLRNRVHKACQLEFDSRDQSLGCCSCRNGLARPHYHWVHYKGTFPQILANMKSTQMLFGDSPKTWSHSNWPCANDYNSPNRKYGNPQVKDLLSMQGACLFRGRRCLRLAPLHEVCALFRNEAARAMSMSKDIERAAARSRLSSAHFSRSHDQNKWTPFCVGIFKWKRQRKEKGGAALPTPCPNCILSKHPEALRARP